MRNRKTLARCLRLGVVYGLSAWSAYAACEFVFSSLLYVWTRPYAAFTSWHWQLTWLLAGGYIAAALLAGSLAGLGVFLLGDPSERRQLELAATFSLVLAFAVHILASPPSGSGWFLAAVSIGYLAAILTSIRSQKWRLRMGLLTNPWVMSAVLLGIGEEFVILDIGLARQFGAPVHFWASLLAVLLLVLAGAAVFAGRLIRANMAWAVAAPVVLVVLIAGSEFLTSSGPSPVHAAVSSQAASSRPNVLLIVLDTVRADHLSIDGYTRHTTPHLEQLARDAVVYTNAESPSDFTLTSHASLFTGVYPSWHGAYCQPPDAAYGRELNEHLPVLAELLHGQKYSTFAVAANLYLRSEFGLERGFQTFEIPRPVPLLTEENWYFLRRPARRALTVGFDTSQFDRLNTLGEDIDRYFFSIMDRKGGSGAPFFAFLNFMDAHFPYVPPPPYSNAFPGKDRFLTTDDLDAEGERITEGDPIPANYQPHAISQYDGGIAYEDAEVGRIVDWLKQHNLYDSTMIVVTTDHGESFGERSHVGHANSPYQNLLHVGLLVKYPNSARTGVEARPVSLIDVAPTVLDIAGVVRPAGMQGVSLLQLPKTRELFSETFPCAVSQSPECPRGCAARAVYSWPYKFITSTNGKRQLYDIQADPEETRDLSQTRAAVAQQLNADLHAWMKTFPAQGQQKVKLDPESLQRLKSLGYVQ